MAVWGATPAEVDRRRGEFKILDLREDIEFEWKRGQPTPSFIPSDLRREVLGCVCALFRRCLFSALLLGTASFGHFFWGSNFFQAVPFCGMSFFVQCVFSKGGGMCAARKASWSAGRSGYYHNATVPTAGGVVYWFRTCGLGAFQGPSISTRMKSCSISRPRQSYSSNQMGLPKKLQRHPQKCSSLNLIHTFTPTCFSKKPRGYDVNVLGAFPWVRYPSMLFFRTFSHN